MDNLFRLLCGLVMLPMIFSVPLIYRPALAHQDRDRGTVLMVAGLLLASFIWVAGGHNLIFGGRPSLLAGPSLTTASNLLVQMDFFLYAIVMFSGSAVPDRSLVFFCSFVPLWLLLVYGPVAWLLWTPAGWLNQIGARDFSGGLVVHLTAGLTSLLLTWGHHPDPAASTPQPEAPSQLVALFLILTGWLGFNLAPLGQLTNLAGLVIVNTFVAVAMAALGWGLVSWRASRTLTLTDLINGVLSGLVTSTALVGYVPPLAMAITAFTSGVICHGLTEWSQGSRHFADPVDSFSINATGGLVGALGLLTFASRTVNPDGGAGMVTGHWQFPIIELLAILVTAIITLSGGWLAIRLATLLTTHLNPAHSHTPRQEQIND